MYKKFYRMNFCGCKKGCVSGKEGEFWDRELSPGGEGAQQLSYKTGSSCERMAGHTEESACAETGKP